MKGNKGITLIALIVTIIVLIILAGVAIAMLAGDNGIIDNATKARYDNAIASFDEKVKMGQMSMKTSITSRMVQISDDGYMATVKGDFEDLVKDLRAELGLEKTVSVTNGGSTSESVEDTELHKEKFTVIYYDPNGSITDWDGTYTDAHGLIPNMTKDDGTDRAAYILITYTDNSLRSSLPKKGSTGAPAESATTFTSGNVKFNLEMDDSTPAKNKYNPNAAVLAYVIKVENYNCTLSEPTLTSISAIEALFEDKAGIKTLFGDT